MAKIVPTILTSSEDEYSVRLSMAENVSDLVQVDVIDSKFADNTTVGTDVIKKYPTSANIEIHLMVVYAQNYVDELVKIDHVSRIIVPFEVEGGLMEAIYHIKSHNKQVGLSLNPATPVKIALHLLDDVDFVLLLAVEPGFSGQAFDEKVIDKVKEAKRLAPPLAVEVDGGVNFDNAPKLTEAGADFLAVNSTLFKAPDFYVAYEKMVKLAKGN